MKRAIEQSRWSCALLVVTSLATAGCSLSGSSSDDSRERTATSSQALTSTNGIWQNGLSTNGIWQNGIWQNGIWQNGIWQNGIWQNGIWQNGIWQNGIWQNGIWQNGIWQNGIWQNGIWQNGIWQNGIWQNGLSTSALQGDAGNGDAGGGSALPGDALRASPYARQLLQYVYACAMPASTLDAARQTGVSYDTTLDPNGGTLACNADGTCAAGYRCSESNTCVIPLQGAIGLGINADGSTWWGQRATDGGVGYAGSCDESCQRWVSACVLARTNAYGVHVNISMRAPADAPQAIKNARLF